MYQSHSQVEMLLLLLLIAVRKGSDGTPEVGWFFASCVATTCVYAMLLLQ